MNTRSYDNEVLPDASKDQHILIDETILNTIVEAAEVKRSDTVLEIGGGSGNITEKLMNCAGKVIVVERDGKYATILKEKFKPASNIFVVHGNVLDIHLPEFNKIVSNMPYSISEPLFLKLIKERKHRFDLAVMVLSGSFVKKMTAPINSPLFGLVSALFMSFYSVEVIATLPKELINPPPRVVSLCVRIVPKASAPQNDKAGFIMQRVFLYDNKKLKNVLLETLWDYGHELTGRKLTKKDADSIIEGIFDKGFKQLLSKRVANFSNDDFRNLVSSLLQWSGRLNCMLQ